MARLYGILVGTCWALGLLSLVAAVALKCVPAWSETLPITTRGGLVFASALFLCALATREIQRMESPAG